MGSHFYEWNKLGRFLAPFDTKKGAFQIKPITNTAHTSVISSQTLKWAIGKDLYNFHRKIIFQVNIRSKSCAHVNWISDKHKPTFFLMISLQWKPSAVRKLLISEDLRSSSIQVPKCGLWGLQIGQPPIRRLRPQIPQPRTVWGHKTLRGLLPRPRQDLQKYPPILLVVCR